MGNSGSIPNYLFPNKPNIWPDTTTDDRDAIRTRIFEPGGMVNEIADLSYQTGRNLYGVFTPEARFTKRETPAKFASAEDAMWYLQERMDVLFAKYPYAIGLIEGIQSESGLQNRESRRNNRLKIMREKAGMGEETFGEYMAGVETDVRQELRFFLGDDPHFNQYIALIVGLGATKPAAEAIVPFYGLNQDLRKEEISALVSAIVTRINQFEYDIDACRPLDQLLCIFGKNEIQFGRVTGREEDPYSFGDIEQYIQESTKWNEPISLGNYQYTFSRGEGNTVTATVSRILAKRGAVIPLYTVTFENPNAIGDIVDVACNVKADFTNVPQTSLPVAVTYPLR